MGDWPEHLTDDERGALDAGDAEEATLAANVERVREEVHSARAAGGIPDELAERWKSVQAALRDHREAHRGRQIELGARGQGIGVIAEQNVEPQPDESVADEQAVAAELEAGAEGGEAQ